MAQRLAKCCLTRYPLGPPAAQRLDADVRRFMQTNRDPEVVSDPKGAPCRVAPLEEVSPGGLGLLLVEPDGGACDPRGRRRDAVRRPGQPWSTSRDISLTQPGARSSAWFFRFISV